MKYEIKKQGDHYEIEEIEQTSFYLDTVNEATPCDGCMHADRCGKERLACFAFTWFVHSGEVDWVMPRQPNRKTFTRTMGKYDTALMPEVYAVRRNTNYGETI